MSNSTDKPGPDLGALFDEHVRLEFQEHDVEATMQTMTANPYVHNVPTLQGGEGASGVRHFYSNHFVNQLPADATVTPISRTVSDERVVDELIVSFTHDRQMDWILPGVPPTGRRLEVPHVVVMKFEEGKIGHEHIYWDQATVLVQAGLLDPQKVPAVGAEQAQKLLAKVRPSAKS